MFLSLDMRSQVQNIFMSSNSTNRQVMMFSATLPNGLKEVCKLYMK